MKLFLNRIISIFLFTAVLFQCQQDYKEQNETATHAEPSLEEARKAWPEMPQQITFIGLKDCPTKFQVYWNGAMSCFVGRDCFGNVFPPQQAITRQFEQDQLHMSLAGGKLPDFQVIDIGQVEQSLLEGYLPIVKTNWQTNDISYTMQTLATALQPELLDPETTSHMSLSLIQVSIQTPDDFDGDSVHLWINFSGYKVLVPTDKELPEDVFPKYGRKLMLDNNKILDDNDRIRAVINEFPIGSDIEFFNEYPVKGDMTTGLIRSRHKGFLNNLMRIRIAHIPGEKVTLVIAIPYFPIASEKAHLLTRNYTTELIKVKEYWQQIYKRDAQLETPDKFVNDFYKAGLWHTLVAADRDNETGMTYAKSSPAWYETMWPNCTMVSAVSLDMRGYHDEAARYLEPFLDWQSVRAPPNMQDASMDGFLCPPEAFCAIPWVSNHGNVLWALCEHYRITKDPLWRDRITDIVLKASDWIIAQRKLTMAQDFGARLLPGGTVSDDKGAGQYLCSDAQNYRGLRSAADFLMARGHIRAMEIDKAASNYRFDIQTALSKAIERNKPITLVDGKEIPFVPAEIHQTEPPAFSENDFWPYINYIDVGPMHLVDCNVIESDSDIADWILKFESSYQVASLRNAISLTENWVHTIRLAGDEPAHLLHHGVSTVEPFYSPRSTMFLENDNIEDYLNVFYHQLASGVSHKNLSPCENRYGVWHMPWADGEYHRMLLRMLVHQQNDNLVLLKAIPRRWLETGEQINVKNQPTEYGPISFQVNSNLNDRFIEMTLDTPSELVPGGIDIRFRHPQGRNILRVELDGASWDNFQDDYVYLPDYPDKNIHLKVFF